MPRDGHWNLGDEISQAIYLADIEPRCTGLGDVSDNGAASHQSYDGPIPWGDAVDMIDPLKPPGAGHLLGNDLRVPGDVLVQLACEEATVCVIAAFARRDDETDDLTAIKIGDPICAREGGW